MFAIIETGGKQYRVAPGDEILVEKLNHEVGQMIHFEKILLVSKEGGEVVVGKPSVTGAQVVGEVLDHGRGKKVVVFKYKPKVNYRKKQGHRQSFTKVKIASIEA